MMPAKFKCNPKNQSHNADDIRNNARPHRGNIINRAYKCLQSKIIQHAIPNSDWPAPQLIFGSKHNPQTSFPKPRKNLKCHNETSGAVRTNSKDMSTIVSGFMQFEKNFKRKKGLENFQNFQRTNCNNDNKDSEMNSVSIVIPSIAIDPDSLGAAIEYCLKQKLNQ